MLKKYYLNESKFYRKKFTLPQLFVVVSYLLYNNIKYGENSESLELSIKLTKVLWLK